MTRTIYESESNTSQMFTKFTINGRAASHNDTVILTLENNERVGTFQPTDDDSVVHENCPNTISQSHEGVKPKVKIIWKAPASRSGCVAISAMVYENSKTWYSDDGKLTEIICESSIRKTDFNV